MPLKRKVTFPPVLIHSIRQLLLQAVAAESGGAVNLNNIKYEKRNCGIQIICYSLSLSLSL